jgi:farnesyl-diphosphate farnesyltransferase
VDSIVTSIHHQQNDDSFIDEFLLGTSRTFALAIPLLNVERHRQIGLSYLLFRVADSIEDAPEGDATLKKNLLTVLNNCIDHACNKLTFEIASSDSMSLRSLWPEQSPTGRLLREIPRLMAIFNQLPTSVAQAIGRSLTSTIAGMIAFIEASANLPNQIQIQTLGDLRLYCYAVAGIVGEMLTDVFVCHHPSGHATHGELRQLSVGFGEFLQLINILKDSRVDAANGRLFIPIEASLESIYELALGGREHALKYIRLLEKNDFPADIILFCRFVYLLADGSLQKLRNGGAGSKLTRDEVMQILSEAKSEPSVLPV